MSPPVGFAEITHEFTGVGVPLGAAVVFGVEHDGIVGPSTLGAELNTLWNTHMRTSYGSEVNMVNTVVKFGPPSTGASAEVSNTGGGGLLSGVATSPNVAFLLVKNTALGGRRGKGRMYLPGVTEASVDQGGNVLASTVTTQSGDANDWLGALAVNDSPMVLFHGPEYVWILVGGQPRRVPTVPFLPLFSYVQTISPSSRVATQRRRLRG